MLRWKYIVNIITWLRKKTLKNIHVDDLATLIIMKNKGVTTIYVDEKKKHIVITFIVDKSYLLPW